MSIDWHMTDIYIFFFNGYINYLGVLPLNEIHCDHFSSDKSCQVQEEKLSRSSDTNWEKEKQFSKRGEAKSLARKCLEA